MPSIPSDANPLMLKWAREKQGLSLAQVAKADNIPLEKLAAWESGSSSPSFPQLRKLSKRYKRPLMVFYLEKPVQEFSIVKDFRTLATGLSASFSPQLRRAIQLAQERQKWASSYLEDVGNRKIELVGSASIKSDPRTVAASLRTALGVTIQDQIACADAYASLNLWRSACESSGIYVFQSTRVSVEEMRGCALPDLYAPVALLNGSDAPVARVFTLIHEVTHILLNQTAITGDSHDDFSMSPVQSVERFCNRVSAETLIPRNDFLAQIPPNWRSNDDAVIRKAASRYQVSRAVIGMRLVETGVADQSYLTEKWPQLQSRVKEREDDGGGIPQHTLALARTGTGFARLALSAYHLGAIHGGELSELMRMKLNHLPKLEKNLYPSRAQTSA